MCQGKSECHGPVRSAVSKSGTIKYHEWSPARSQVRGLIVAIPGFDESACEMQHLGGFLSPRGYAVYARDLRGQGGDPDKSYRGNFSDWKTWVADVHELASLARREHPQAPLFYVGQSTGGIIALAAAAKANRSAAPAGIILQSPGILFVLPSAISRPLLAAGEVLTLNQSRFTTPAVLALKKQAIMINEADEAAWERSSDRVCQGFTFKCASACYALGADVAREMSGLRQPILVQYGKQDPVFELAADPQKSPCRFVSMIGSHDKEVQWIDPGRHDMLNDRTTRQKLLARVDSWLRAHRGISAPTR